MVHIFSLYRNTFSNFDIGGETYVISYIFLYIFFFTFYIFYILHLH